MIFTGVCLITGDVPRLVQFYEYVLRCPARGDDTRAEIATPGCALTICTQQAARSDMGFGLTSSCGASRTILRFAVDDVDEEYQRLRRVDVSFACLPTSHSWGARTVHFHDPDGNLVSFYRPLAQPEADTDASADKTGGMHPAQPLGRRRQSSITSRANGRRMSSSGQGSTVRGGHAYGALSCSSPPLPLDKYDTSKKAPPLE